MGQAHGDVGTWLHEGMLGMWAWGRGCGGWEHEDRGTWVHNRQRGHGGHERGDGGRHTGAWTHKGTWGPGGGDLEVRQGRARGCLHTGIWTWGSPGDIRGVPRAGATPATPTASPARPSAPSTWRMWSGRSRDTSLSPEVLGVPGPPCPRSGCHGPGTPHPAGSPGCVRGPCPHAGCATGLAAVPGWAQPLPSSPPGTSPMRRWPSPRSTRCCTAPWPPLAGGPSSPAPAPGARGQGGWAWGHGGGALCKVPRQGCAWPCGCCGVGRVLVQARARPWCAGV